MRPEARVENLLRHGYWDTSYWLCYRQTLVHGLRGDILARGATMNEQTRRNLDTAINAQRVDDLAGASVALYGLVAKLDGPIGPWEARQAIDAAAAIVRASAGALQS